MCARKKRRKDFVHWRTKMKEHTVWRSRRTAEEKKIVYAKWMIERWAELSRHLFRMEKENANVRFIFSSSSSYSLFSLWSSLPLPSLSLATKLAESFAVAFFLIFIHIHIVSVVPNHNFFLCLHDRTSYSFLTRTRPKKKKIRTLIHRAIKQQTNTHTPSLSAKIEIKIQIYSWIHSHKHQTIQQQLKMKQKKFCTLSICKAMWNSPNIGCAKVVGVDRTVERARERENCEINDFMSMSMDVLEYKNTLKLG